MAIFGRTGMNRSLNRGKWPLADLEDMLACPTSAAARSLSAHLRVLKVRAEHPAFHPDGPQQVAALTDAVLGIERRALDGTERILVLANPGNQPEHLSRATLQAHGWQKHGPADLLTGRGVVDHAGVIPLEAYEALWLVLSA